MLFFEFIERASDATMFPSIREAAIALAELMETPSQAAVELTDVCVQEVCITVYGPESGLPRGQGWTVNYARGGHPSRFLQVWRLMP